MDSILKDVKKAILSLVQRKLATSKYDEIGLVLFGADETSNELHLEVGGYEHVYISRPINVVDDDLLELFDNLPRGSASADYLDAIVVGMDMLIKNVGEGKKGNKRLYLITDGESLVKEPAGDVGIEEQVDQIGSQLVEHCMKLDAVFVNSRQNTTSFMSSTRKSKIRLENETLMQRFSKTSRADFMVADSPTTLMGTIKPRNVTPVTIYRGDMELTPHMNVKVWVYKKVSLERFPTLKRYSDKAPPSDQFATKEIKMDTLYRSTEDPDKIVPPESRIKGYRYGPQLVPVSHAEEDAFRFKTDKGLKLIGFTNASNVLRHHYMKEANIFIPEPGNKKSIIAISALARAMKEAKKVAIVRCVWRQNQTSVDVGVLIPYVSEDDNVADCFYFNNLPFAEDVRAFPFASFEDFPPTMQPSQTQQEVMDNFVKMLDLAPVGKEEVLRPERTPNPILQRWYSFLHAKLKDPVADVPPLEETLKGVVDPPPALISQNNAFIEEIRNRFTLQPHAQEKALRKFWKDNEANEDGKADVAAVDNMELGSGQISFDSLTARQVDEVGRLNPVSDFEAMLARRDSDEWVHKAIREMKKIVNDFLDAAYKGNTYEKAIACLVSLRKGCVQEEEPVVFNNFLRELSGKCRGKRLNDFWQQIIDKGITLISKKEAPDSNVTEEEANTFLAGGTSGAPSSELVVEEEVDEMEALLGEAI